MTVDANAIANVCEECATVRKTELFADGNFLLAYNANKFQNVIKNICFAVVLHSRLSEKASECHCFIFTSLPKAAE